MVVGAATLADVCTVSNVQASLPANGTLLGISFNTNSVTANAVYNSSSQSSANAPASVIDYCNVTLSYSHNGLEDNVNLQYWFPAPDSYEKRYLATGGEGFSINSGSQGFAGGVMYGAVTGATDGGFGGWNAQLIDVVLKANGTLNWDPIFMFGYQAIGETTQIGKAMSRLLYNMTADEKIYTYYQGCSEGGREGWSQVQRYGEEYDGVIPGAPALRFAQQQVQHLYSNVVEQTLDYYPSPCELAQIVNATITFCDPLDGKTDGVVSRTDLCKLHFNVSSVIGTPYSCAASGGGSMGGNSTGTGPPTTAGKMKRQMGAPGGGGGGSSTPAVNGTVSSQAAAVAQAIMDGLHTTDGKRAYFSYQPSAAFTDAQTTYDNTTNSFKLSIAGTGGEFVTRFIQLVEEDNLPNLDNVTYDTLRDWMQEAWNKYEDTLQTTLPDLTPFYSRGGKVLSYHGESDFSIPAASSVHYYESVRNIMYPNTTFNDSSEALGDWYRLFLVPGAGHCAVSSSQPNGPWPQTNLEVLINWVENATVPVTLNATHLSGDYKGQSEQLCAWPLRPYWTGNGTTMECEYDQASIDTWMYTLDAFKLPVY